MCNHKALLLNASNMDGFPVYSYAFIQVPAVARQSGIEVICTDMLGIPQGSWEQTIQTLIKQHNPTMILITLRNTDSLKAQDYEPDGSKDAGGNTYFPIEQTKSLIAAIRAVSDLKIAVGGFGFSIMPNELMHYLHPDFGVFGDPDAFFEHFEEILQGNYDQVANLLYFKDDQLFSNPLVFYAPLADAEYTPQIIYEMMAFYDTFSSPGFQGAPVEIMRGCRHSCVFCSEPHVKGSKVRYRDLSAVMADIEILVDHGITRLYIVSSELNPEGNAFVLELADRILAFNKQQPDDRKVTWFGANYLLNFSNEEYESLYKSGFTGGWFDITALDDENALAMRTPYRNKNLIANLRAYAHFERARLSQLKARDESDADELDNENNTKRSEIAVSWSLFLGNPTTSTETIRNTLQVANQEGLPQLFTNCSLFTKIRVFDYEEPDHATLDLTYSVTPDLKRTGYHQILPSFAYPPALIQDFGSEEEISHLFKYIAETYLSTKYQKSRDWHSFIKQNTAAASITSWMAELSETHRVHVPAHIRPINKGKPSPVLQHLFSEEEPKGEEIYTYENLANQVVDSLLSICLEAFPNLFASVGLPATMENLKQRTPYDLAVLVFDKWSTEQELVDELTEQFKTVLGKPMQDYVRFCVQVILYRFNILINPKYRSLFVPVGLTD